MWFAPCREHCGNGSARLQEQSSFSCRVGVLAHHRQQMVGEYTHPTGKCGGPCPPYASEFFQPGCHVPRSRGHVFLRIVFSPVQKPRPHAHASVRHGTHGTHGTVQRRAGTARRSLRTAAHRRAGTARRSRRHGHAVASPCHPKSSTSNWVAWARVSVPVRFPHGRSSVVVQDRLTPWRCAPLPPHPAIRRLDIARKLRGIHQRRACHSFSKRRAKLRESLQIVGQRNRDLHVFFRRVSDELGQPEVGENAQPAARDGKVSGKADYRHAHPERIASLSCRRCMGRGPAPDRSADIGGNMRSSPWSAQTPVAWDRVHCCAKDRAPCPDVGPAGNEPAAASAEPASGFHTTPARSAAFTFA